MRRDEPGLPPLVIGSVDDMEDVSVREAQALAGQAAVPRSIVVKQSSDNRTGRGEDSQHSFIELSSTFKSTG